MFDILQNFKNITSHLQKLSIIAICLLPCSLVAQSDFIVVDKIEVSGNKKTKRKIIIRELGFVEQDTLPLAELSDIISKARERLLSTSIFNTAEINISKWRTEEDRIELEVLLEEDWFIYPLPIFNLADRNFNIWWNEYNRSFKRVNYGMRFYHFNTTGNRDRLKLVGQFGFTNRFEIDYNYPFINKKQTLGLRTGLEYKTQKTLSYNTINNKESFLNTQEEILLKTLQVKTDLSYRPGLYTYHYFTLQYFNNEVADTIGIGLNKDFFLNGHTKQQYISFKYAIEKDRRDFRSYPTKGNYFLAVVQKEGFGLGDINTLKVNATYLYYLPITTKWNLELIAKAETSVLRQKKPFNNSRLLGFKRDVLRGYELYLLDGIDFFYLKTSFRFKFFKKSLNLKKVMPIKQFQNFPIQTYLTFNNDIGWTNNPDYGNGNELSNRMLWGGGIGIDLLIYYDYVFQIEYNVNHLWENRLYLKTKLPF